VLVGQYGKYNAEGLRFRITEILGRNYIKSNSPMQLGMYSSLESFPSWYVWNEMTWLTIACIIIMVFTIFSKTLDHFIPYIKKFLFRGTTDIQDANPLIHNHSHLPEYIRKTFLLENYGIHMNTSRDELKVINGSIVLNPAALWAGGWVLFAEKYLVHMSDIPHIWLCLVLRKRFVNIYCSIILDGDNFTGILEPIPLQNIHRVAWYDFSFRSLHLQLFESCFKLQAVKT